MEYLVVKEVGNGTKRYLDKEGAFGLKSLGYRMPEWMARLIIRSWFSYDYGHSLKFFIEEAR